MDNSLVAICPGLALLYGQSELLDGGAHSDEGVGAESILFEVYTVL